AALRGSKAGRRKRSPSTRCPRSSPASTIWVPRRRCSAGNRCHSSSPVRTGEDSPYRDKRKTPSLSGGRLRTQLTYADRLEADPHAVAPVAAAFVLAPAVLLAAAPLPAVLVDHEP